MPYLPLLPAAEHHRPLAGTHFTIPQRVEGWVDLGGWFHTEIQCCPGSRTRTVIHRSTNRAQRRLTSLIETNVLPLRQTATCCTCWEYLKAVLSVHIADAEFLVLDFRHMFIIKLVKRAQCPVSQELTEQESIRPVGERALQARHPSCHQTKSTTAPMGTENSDPKQGNHPLAFWFHQLTSCMMNIWWTCSTENSASFCCCLLCNGQYCYTMVLSAAVWPCLQRARYNVSCSRMDHSVTVEGHIFCPGITLTFDLDVQTCLSEGPNTFPPWIWHKSVQRFLRYLIHKQTKKNRVTDSTKNRTLRSSRRVVIFPI